MPYDYPLSAIVVARSTTTIYLPFDAVVEPLTTHDFASVVDYHLPALALPESFRPLSAQLAYTVDTTSMVMFNGAGWFPSVGRDFLAVFTLERDEDGDMIFADTTGAMYGLGRTFLQAVQDWHDSAQELEAQLQEHTGDLLDQVAEQLQLFERVLSEAPALGQS